MNRRLPLVLRRAAAAAAVALVALASGTVPGTSSRAALPPEAPRPPAARDAAATPRLERLRYRATWNAVPVANAELIVQPQTAGGRAGSVSLRGRAETNEVLDLLWRMRDSFEATVGLGPVTPGRFVLRQNENDRRRDTTIVARPPHLIGTVERRHHRPRLAQVTLAPRLHDPASVAYLIRTLPPELEQHPSYAVLAGTKIYDLTIAPSGSEAVEAAGRTWPARRFHLALKLEPIDVESRDAGRVKTVAATLPAEDGTAATDAAAADDDGTSAQPWRELKVQEADLWISSGPERLPLRLRARTYWGWVAVELVGRGAAPAASP